MTLKDQYRNQAQSDLDAATALACDLAEGDPATFKAGYSPANAAIAAAEVFGLDEQDKLWIERAVAGRSIGRAKQEATVSDVHYYMIETAFCRAMESVAMGETRTQTRKMIREYFPTLSEDETQSVMTDALADALAQGIEREDISRSWFK